MVGDYGVGLDIGTSSIGYSVVDDNGRLIRVKGDRGIGVRLYREAQKAEERRQKRTARRRLSRRRWRLKFLREFFDEPIAQIDPGFFERLKYYNESPRDEQAKGLSKALFDTKTNAEFAHEYPTIYHLRRALMTENRKFDVREIYLAIHHIVKYRGNFLNNAPVSQFKSNQINYDEKVTALSKDFAEIISDDEFKFGVTGTQLKQTLLEDNISPSDRGKKLLALFNVKASNDTGVTAKELKEINARNKQIAKEIGNALSGLTVHLDVLFQIEVDPEMKKTWQTKLESIEEFWAEHDADIEDEARLSILNTLQEIYADIFLIGQMPNGVSARMISIYEDHAKDLAKYKELARRQPTKLRKELLDEYGYYIEGKKSKAVSQEDFLAAVKKKISGIDDSLKVEILTEIENGKFMPKPRSKENALIPHQLHQQELDRIIENQRKYYPWLDEENPVTDHLADQPYKLDELVSFRVPYYTGPLITPIDQQKSSDAKFAWMVRKDDGNITPWNFDEKVDRSASATQFIERMKTTDTYLMGENVLPASSLLYQKYVVLNELNGIQVDGEHLSTEQKAAFIRQCFMQQATVKKSDLVNMLRADGDIPANVEPTIKGLNESNQFNGKLSTYRDLVKIIPNEVNKPERQDDIEKIVEWSTLFEDGNIFVEKLNEISWLNQRQRQQLATKRYRGWGRLSAELLTQVKNKRGQNIMTLLETSSKNFMQLMHDKEIASAVEKHNQNIKYGVDEIIDKAYTSPSNRKALRQVMAVLKDIERALGKAPKYVYIESADGPQKNKKQTFKREHALLAIYEKNAEAVSDEVMAELQQKVKNKEVFTDKLVLYFSQNGYDAYTNKKIDINRLMDYDIDHIIPQSYVKDNSFDNRVLTSKVENEKNKEAGFAADNYPNQLGVWKLWRKAGLISERKFKNLTLHQHDFDKQSVGFIKRQLVETRQIIKLTQQVLQVHLPETSKIINIKADLSHDFRATFDFPKNRDVNDYHHAFDAYLAAFIGTYLRKQFPYYRALFEYGNFDPIRNQKEFMRKANFIYALTKNDKMSNVDGEITWDKAADLAELNRVYEYKTMRVSYETYEYTGALNGETRWKAADAKVNGGSKAMLVPFSKNRPVEVYGGFEGSKPSYLAIVKVIDSKNETLKVVPILARDVAKIANARKISKQAEFDLLVKIIAPRFKKKDKVPVIEIVKPRVALGTIFKNPTRGIFRIVSNKEYRNTIQLWLSKREVKLLTRPKKVNQNEPTKQEMLSLFDTILAREEIANPLLGLKIKALKQTRDQFAALEVQDTTEGNKIQLGMISVLDKILAGLHANANLEDLKIIGGPTNFGRMQMSGDITLESGTKIIMQSASALFTKQIELDK